VKLYTWGFAGRFILFCQNNCPWRSKKFAISNLCCTQLKKNLTYRHETLQECWSACVGVHQVFLRVDLFSICRVIALDLLKIYNFHLVSHVVQNLIDIGSWNFTGIFYYHMKLSTEWLACEFICFVRVIALDLVKISNFQFVLWVAQNIFNLESFNQECWSACVVVYLWFHLWIYPVIVDLLPLT
jgi:hypothetical protein